jgi:formylglycine-generating enzyme required for sulfatase activity/uncharacterized RDD family membrane protein YckC
MNEQEPAGTHGILHNSGPLPDQAPPADPATGADRLVAYVLDLLLLILVVLMPGFVLAGKGWFPEDRARNITVFLLLLSMFLYPAILNVWPGQTLGRWVVGTRVVDWKGQGLRFGQSALRTLMFFMSSALTSGLGHLAIPFNKRRRALHDYLAGTYVVTVRPKGWVGRAGIDVFAVIIVLLVLAGIGKKIEDAQMDNIKTAREILGLLATLEERHKSEHGRYTSDLGTLALQAGKPKEFLDALPEAVLDGSVQLTVTEEGQYVIQAKALDNGRSNVSLLGPRVPARLRKMGEEYIGKDGAPMVLVPAGKFLYGKKNERLSVQAFYMDKYELTAARYARFMKATGWELPKYWNEANLASDEDRPVIGVSWYDAEAYCTWVGKRLPTEQEWEKAARGLDGRKYPWGNEEPVRTMARFDWDGNTDWQGYRTLSPVGSFEAGKSPYGVHDLAGNVWEWTGSDADKENKVVRGGSWFNGAEGVSAWGRNHAHPWDSFKTHGFRCVEDAWFGKDGAPMVLVPAGEFLYGDNNRRLSLPAFYMDKYEVTTRLYAAFMQATGREKPKYWNEVRLTSHGDRPVVGVSWHDAEAYCRHYGKRLPTEQEWEKAARGTDGRKYPWGNEKPTSRHANFDRGRDFQNYGVLVNVGSLEDGRSPDGIYDLAGNVFEWTASDYDHEQKMVRGGSWGAKAGHLVSANGLIADPAEKSNHLGFRCAHDTR